MKTEKIFSKLGIASFSLLMIFLTNIAFAQGPIVVSTNPEIHASKNPRIYSGDTEEGMIKLSISEAKLLYNSIDEDIADNWDGYGIKGTVQDGGYINIVLYGYDSSKSDGRGNFIYGVSLETTTTTSYGGTYWDVKKNEYLREQFVSSEETVPSNKAFKSIIAAAAKYFKNTSEGNERKFKNNSSVPLVVEATIYKAELTQFKFPGIDIVTDPTFALPHNSGTKDNFGSLYANYSNYTSDVIAINGNISKYYKIKSEINPTLENKKILRMGQGENTSIANGFMRIEVPRSGVLHFAALFNSDLNFFPNNSELDLKFLSEAGVPAFKVIVDYPDQVTVEEQFFLYTVHNLHPGSTLFVQARQTGPYLIASNIHLRRKPIENSGNRNFVNPSYGYYHNNFIVCAHRGYWLEKGIPENHPAAFKKAFALDNDYMTMIELDVAYTKDNIPVLMHDTTVDRLTTFWDEAPSTLKKTDIKNIYYYKESIDNDHTYPFKNYGPLRNAKLKDRFGNVVTDVPSGTSNRVYTLEDVMDYFKDKLDEGKKFTVALDKVTARINEAFGIVLKSNMEQYVIFKGPAKTYQVSNLENRLGPVMEQIMYTPYFFSELESAESSFDDIYDAFIEKDELLTPHRWFIPAMEMQMKTDYDNAPTNKKEGNLKMKAKIEDLKTKRKWVGITPVVPSRCDGVDVKTLFDNCTEADMHDPLKAASCSNYDWRADLNFGFYEVGTNYWITDRPLYTIDFLKERPVN